MAQEKVINGYRVRRNDDGTFTTLGPAQAPADPTFEYKAPAAQADLTGQNIANQRSAFELQQAEALAEANRRKAEADALMAEQQASLAQAQGNRPPLSATDRVAALRNFNSALEITPMIGNLEKRYKEGPGSTKLLYGLGDFLPTEANERFNQAADKFRGFVKAAQGFTGGEGNTAAEAKMNIGAFIPSAGQFDKTIEDNIEALKQERNRSFGANVMLLGGIPDQSGNVTPVPRGYRIGQYPDLDVAVSRHISRVPMEKRGEYMMRARKKYLGIMAAPKTKAKASSGWSIEQVGD